MSKLVIAFACVALFQIATALKCYTCDKDSCAKDVSAWGPLECGKAAEPYEMTCLTHKYKDTKDQKEYTIRKCETRNKNEQYKCAKLGEELTCELCTSDLCNKNSASAVSLSFTAICGVFLAVIVPKLYL